MRRTIRSFTQKIDILRPYECDPDDIPMEFGDRFFTLDFLHRLTLDPLNMITIRNAISEFLPVVDVLRLTDDAVLQQFAWQIACGYFKLIPREEKIPRIMGPGVSPEADSEADSQDDSAASSGAGTDGAGAATETAEEAPAGGAASTDTDTDTDATEEETDWIEFKVVNDETEQPMSGIGLKIKLTTGETKDYTTDSSGMVRIDDLPPGTCDIEEIRDPDASEIVQVE